MNSLKNYGSFLISLCIALIVLHFALKVLKKAPLVGGVADKVEELAFDVE